MEEDVVVLTEASSLCQGKEPESRKVKMVEVDVENKLTKCRQVCWRVDLYIIIILGAIYRRGPVLGNINMIDLQSGHYYEIRGANVFDVTRMFVMKHILSSIEEERSKMPRPGPRPYECVRRAWHSERHQPMRGSIIQQILRLAIETHSTATKKNKEWQDKIITVIVKAEEIMYSKANSEVLFFFKI
ncbi:hypothetical protein Gorai_007250, partial [Gossypium raimondii]|nr:hypothetical protein [Gossypium raimondii]